MRRRNDNSRREVQNVHADSSVSRGGSQVVSNERGDRQHAVVGRLMMTTYIDPSVPVAVYVPERFSRAAREAVRTADQVRFTTLPPA